MLLRGSAWPQQRWRPDLDGQTFRVNRGRLVRGAGNRNVFVPHPAYWRTATCMEVDCAHYERGWWTRIPLGAEQDPEDLAMNRTRYNYIRNASRRAYTETWDGSEAVFHFSAEQPCFRPHKLPLERDPVFIHMKRPGQYQPMDYDQYFDTFNETSYQLNRRLDRHA